MIHACSKCGGKGGVARITADPRNGMTSYRYFFGYATSCCDCGASVSGIFDEVIEAARAWNKANSQPPPAKREGE